MLSGKKHKNFGLLLWLKEYNDYLYFIISPLHCGSGIVLVIDIFFHFLNMKQKKLKKRMTLLKRKINALKMGVAFIKK